VFIQLSGDNQDIRDHIAYLKLVAGIKNVLWGRRRRVVLI